MKRFNQPTFILILVAICMLASLYFFYVATELLAQKDYIAAVLAIFVGLTLIRSAVESQKLLLFRDDGEP